jgi:hypothetical protein
VDKGKGKEKEFAMPTPDDGQDADEEDGGKKKKNSYKHLIRGIPGEFCGGRYFGGILLSYIFPLFFLRKTLNEERRVPNDDNASPS